MKVVDAEQDSLNDEKGDSLLTSELLVIGACCYLEVRVLQQRLLESLMR